MFAGRDDNARYPWCVSLLVGGVILRTTKTSTDAKLNALYLESIDYYD